MRRAPGGNLIVNGNSLAAAQTISVDGSAVSSAAFSNTAGELRFESAGGSSWLVQGDTDGNGVADIEFLVVVSDADPITGSDFIA